MKIRTSLLAITINVIAILLFGLSAKADVVFNNFGAGDSYGSGEFNIFGSDAGGADLDQGFAFTPTGNYTLDTIEMALGLESGTNELNVLLMSDSAGEPGSIIETFNFTNQLQSVASGGSIVSASSVLNPVLSAGNQYWLIGDTPITDTFAKWFFNSIGDTGPKALRFDQGPWLTDINGERGAFRVRGTVVPEPISSILFLTGGATVGLRLFWKKRTK